MPATAFPWRAGGDRLVGRAATVVGRHGWAILLGGCHLPSRDGPVPRSLASCRQLSQRGVSASEREDWSSAETLFGQAVQTCGVDPEARRHFAEALWHQGQQRKAIEQLDEAIRLAGDDDRLYVRAAEMRLAMGDLPGASEKVGTAIDLNPQSATAWELQGQILRKRNQPREALAAYYRALGSAPENRDVLMALAETYRAMNDPQRALLKLQTLADTYQAGDEPQKVLYLQGLALSALGRPAGRYVDVAGGWRSRSGQSRTSLLPGRSRIAGRPTRRCPPERRAGFGDRTESSAGADHARPAECGSRSAHRCRISLNVASRRW